MRLGLVYSQYNELIVRFLKTGALEAWGRLGGRSEDVLMLEVPGALELPWGAQKLAREGQVDGIVALGCVIRGETSHYDLVCQNACAGLMRVGLDHALPLTQGLLTCDTLEQAWARVGGKSGHKGREAVQALWSMMQQGDNV